jgi:hypothetical protein
MASPETREPPKGGSATATAAAGSVHVESVAETPTRRDVWPMRDAWELAAALDGLLLILCAISDAPSSHRLALAQLELGRRIQAQRDRAIRLRQAQEARRGVGLARYHSRRQMPRTSPRRAQPRRPRTPRRVARTTGARGDPDSDPDPPLRVVPLTRFRRDVGAWLEAVGR